MATRVLATVLLILAAACGGGTEPTAVRRIYGLESIDGVSLPVPIIAPWRAAGGTLGLEANGEFAMSVGTESSTGATGPIMGWAGTYRQTGPVIILTADLSSGNPSGEVIVGTVEGSTLTLRYDLEFGTAAQDDDERLLFTLVR